MQEWVDIRIPPEKIDDWEFIDREVQKEIVQFNRGNLGYRLQRKSIDARQKNAVYQLRFVLFEKGKEANPRSSQWMPKDVSRSKPVGIIGAGPAGLFAALKLIELGYKPILFERGKEVRRRRRDLRSIQQENIVDPDSNYCFGEGGAGTYSDGKLYTRSKKRGNIERILQLLVDHGASEDILVDAHPHIGSNKLPGIIQKMRGTIEECGGEYYFDHRMVNFSENGSMGITSFFSNGSKFNVEALILATGHSARDIYHLVNRKGLEIESKPFALGIRAEHDQNFIDRAQYNKKNRGPYLPAASYSLKASVGDRSIFSFCMCPGGLIVPAATAPGEIVVNGMSLSRRDSPFANSGVVVTVDPSKDPEFQKYGVFASLRYQEMVEKKMFEDGNGSLNAPAQRIGDFVDGRISESLNRTSYIPGIHSSPLHKILPNDIVYVLQEGFRQFERKMKGYLTNEANIVGVESRTSAPVRIPRHHIFCNHPQMDRLFPCGEGAGYAGGIVSAALDGERVVQGMNKFFKNK
ncbi:NAD(P)/FAD-dependent oxidoreductase [Membranihabitans maritimus]|uniref:NAD(P)/FAD-dependent oxidoreductase n=1 Tax=Membranihabitans maritimus TaxID=2904244 RepID=UPI001F243D67|nr:FAD-binding protein [Membranihabitans maritimus]